MIIIVYFVSIIKIQGSQLLSLHILGCQLAKLGVLRRFSRAPWGRAHKVETGEEELNEALSQSVKNGPASNARTVLFLGAAVNGIGDLINYSEPQRAREGLGVSQRFGL